MSQSNTISLLFLTGLTTSTIVNTFSLGTTWATAVDTAHFLSILNLLLLGVSCMQYILAICIVILLWVYYCQSKDFERNATGVITMNLFLLFMVQILHVLDIAINKDEFTSTRLVLSIVSIGLLLIAEGTIFGSLIMYACPQARFQGQILPIYNTTPLQVEEDPLLSITGYNQSIQSSWEQSLATYYLFIV